MVNCTQCQKSFRISKKYRGKSPKCRACVPTSTKLHRSKSSVNSKKVVTKVVEPSSQSSPDSSLGFSPVSSIVKPESQDMMSIYVCMENDGCGGCTIWHLVGLMTCENVKDSDIKWDITGTLPHTDDGEAYMHGEASKFICDKIKANLKNQFGHACSEFKEKLTVYFEDDARISIYPKGSDSTLFSDVPEGFWERIRITNEEASKSKLSALPLDCPTAESPTTKPEYTESELKKKTVKELKKIAKIMGMKGYSKMRKADLINSIKS